MRLQNLDPGLVEGLGCPRLAGVVDDALHHRLDFRLALVVRAFPLLIGGAKGMPVGALRSSVLLDISALAVGKGDYPVLDQVTLRVRLYVDRHVFVVRGALALRVEIPVLPAVGIGKDRRAGGSGSD